MARTRAKFRCNWVRDHGDNKLVQLGVVYSKVQGTEDADFTKATPSGHIEMQVDNPAAAVQFKPGRFYYVDFTECPEEMQTSGYKPETLNPVG
jgi:hypothetical protein